MAARLLCLGHRFHFQSTCHGRFLAVSARRQKGTVSGLQSSCGGNNLGHRFHLQSTCHGRFLAVSRGETAERDRVRSPVELWRQSLLNISRQGRPCGKSRCSSPYCQTLSLSGDGGDFALGGVSSGGVWSMAAQACLPLQPPTVLLRRWRIHRDNPAYFPNRLDVGGLSVNTPSARVLRGPTFSNCLLRTSGPRTSSLTSCRNESRFHHSLTESANITLAEIAD